MWRVFCRCRAKAYVCKARNAIAGPGPQHASRQNIEDVPALADKALVILQSLTACYQKQDLFQDSPPARELRGCEKQVSCYGTVTVCMGCQTLALHPPASQQGHFRSLVSKVH